MRDFNYRYFLGFRPSFELRRWLVSLYGPTGQRQRCLAPENLHLTLCVIAETFLQDRFIAARVEAALAGHTLAAPPFWLGRMQGGANGAAIHAIGRQVELQTFYRLIVTRLATRGVFPLHRKSGLRPHVTLGRDPCRFDRFITSREWIPDALHLIESEQGRGIHNLLRTWPLLSPNQGFLPFDPLAPPSPALLVAGCR